jgi:DNA-directed RNA polymerase specialized sigma24 family protein
MGVSVLGRSAFHVGLRAEAVARRRGDVGVADELLMARVDAGSTEAFEVLYDRFYERAQSVAWWFCREDGLAEDALCEAFLSVWRGEAGDDPARGTTAAWLLSVVRRCALDALRGLVAEPPDSRSEVVALAVYGRLTVPEIARVVDLPVATVKRHMRLGVDELRAGIEPRTTAVTLEHGQPPGGPKPMLEAAGGSGRRAAPADAVKDAARGNRP